MKSSSVVLRFLWVFAIGLSSWCYVYLARQAPSKELSTLQAKNIEVSSEEETIEEETTFFLPDLSLLKKAMDLAGRLAGFSNP